MDIHEQIETDLSHLAVREKNTVVTKAPTKITAVLLEPSLLSEKGQDQ